MWVWNKYGIVILFDKVVWSENYFLSGRFFYFNVFKVFNMNLVLGKEGKEKECLLKSGVYFFFLWVCIYGWMKRERFWGFLLLC